MIFIDFSLQNEMSALKADNDRLHKLMSASRTFNFSQSSLTHTRASNDSLDRSLSLTDQSSLGKQTLSLLFLYIFCLKHFILQVALFKSKIYMYVGQLQLKGSNYFKYLQQIICFHPFSLSVEDLTKLKFLLNARMQLNVSISVFSSSQALLAQFF